MPRIGVPPSDISGLIKKFLIWLSLCITRFMLVFDSLLMISDTCSKLLMLLPFISIILSPTSNPASKAGPCLVSDPISGEIFELRSIGKNLSGSCCCSDELKKFTTLMSL